MKIYKVTIYPITPWVVEVQAKNENEAKNKALELDGPVEYAFHGDYLDEWKHEILEWPNIGNREVDIEEI